MITIRNSKLALSLSAKASTADLVSGMLVCMDQGAASGDQPLVRKATSGEMANSLVQKFIVEYDWDDSNDVDFTVNPSTQVLTAIAKLIPINAQVNVWMGTIVVGYHESAIPTSLETARESVRVGFDAATNLPSIAADAEFNCGFKYRIDGPEHTFVMAIPSAAVDLLV